jgi:hypothetical protein
MSDKLQLVGSVDTSRADFPVVDREIERSGNQNAREKRRFQRGHSLPEITW